MLALALVVLPWGAQRVSEARGGFTAVPSPDPQAPWSQGVDRLSR